MSALRRGSVSSRRQFLAAACAPVVLACLGCGGNAPNTKQLDNAGTVLITVGGVTATIPAGWTQITGLVLILVGAALKMYVVFADGERAEVKVSAEQLVAVQEAQSKGEMAEIKQSGTVQKVIIADK